MHLITFPLNAGDSGSEVTNLQNALLFLLEHEKGLIEMSDDERAKLIDQVKGERDQQLYREATSRAIVLFRAPRGLGEKDDVDAPTADGLNKALVELRALDPDTRFVVSGVVRDSNGKPHPGVLVRAFGQEVGSDEQPLGEAKSGRDDGKYEISFGPDKFRNSEKGNMHLRVIAADEADRELASSSEIFKAGSKMVLDLTIPAALPPVEWVRIDQEIRPLLAEQGTKGNPLDPAELTDRDIEILAKVTGLDREQLRLFAMAFKLVMATKLLSDAQGLGELNAAVFYGLFRQELPTSLVELLGQDIPQWRAALEKSAGNNIIPQLSDGELDEIVKKLLAVKAALLLKPADKDQPPSLGDLLKISPLSQDKQRTVAALQVEHGASEGFWRALNAKEGFSAKEIKEVRLTLQLGALTTNHLPLIRELQHTITTNGAVEGAKSDPASQVDQRQEVAFVDLNPTELHPFAQLDVTDWKTILLRPQADGQPIGAPSATPGANLNEKIDNYAAALNQYIENVLPTAVIASRLEKETADDSPFKSVQLDLKTFFDNNPSFEFRDTPVELYLKDGRDQKLSNVSQPEALVVHLRILQRVFNITPHYPNIRALVADGMHSGYAMVHFGKRRFTEKYAEPLGGPSKALEVYGKAEHAHATALNIYMKYGVGFNSPTPYVISGGTTGTPTPERALISYGISADSMASDLSTAVTPDWTKLFGSLDVCDCDHCRSLYSPSAYLVDTLKFLKDGPKKDDQTETPLQVLLDRRPDIANIELTCENTTTEMPYVDLVNELLEEALSSTPIWHWEFDEGMGKITYDTSGSGNNGILSSQSGPGPRWETGKIGTNSLSFDGNFDYVQFPYMSGQRLNGIGSICVWIYPKGVGSLSPRGTIIAKDDEFVISWQLSSHGGAIDWHFPNRHPAEVWHAAGGYIAPVNEWTHIAIVFDKNKVKTYANGQLVDDASSEYKNQDSYPKEMTIGGRPGMLQYFYGIIDDVRLYDRALDSDDIRFTAEAQPKHQTRGTAQELAANPENINTAAYDRLSKAIYPWNLPFNLGREEGRIYLKHLGVQRTEIMEAFYNGTPLAALTDADIAREFLDMSPEEANVIDGTTIGGPSSSTPNSGTWNFWGLLQSGNDLADPSDGTAIHVTGDWDEVLKHVSVFLQQSGLTYKELLELLGTYFINPPASADTPGGRLLAIVPTDASDPTTCNLSKLEIQVVDNAIATDGYTDEGIACYVFDKEAPKTTPLYRLYNSKSSDHFYTTSESERNNSIATDGYTDEGIACYVFDKEAPKTTPLYRLYNSKSSDHFYTASESERNDGTATDGYTDEGIACYVFDKQASDTTPMYRLYNQKSGDHFYTTSESERNNAILDKKGKLKTVWNKIHRFVRLSRKLGWTMHDLDMAITAFSPADLNSNDFLTRLSHIQRLCANLNVPVVNILSWWADIGTASYIDQLSDGQPEIVSLYRQLFRNKAVIKPLDEAFTEDAKALTGKLSDHLPTLSAALGISGADLSQLTTGTAAVPTNNNLNLVNLSKLYRVASLAKALKLSIREWLTVKALIEIDPFATTEATLHFAEKVKTIRASGFSIDELDYLLRHDFGPASVVAPAEEVIAASLDDIRSELQKIAAENTFRVDPGDPDGVTTDPAGELTRKKLALLNWDTALIEQVLATLNGSVTYEAITNTFLTDLDLPNDTGSYEVPLAALPNGFAFPGELNGVVTADPTFKFACDSGIPIETVPGNGTISNDLSDKFSSNSIILAAPITVITVTTDTTWTIKGQPNAQYSVVKNGGILSVYDLSVLKLRVSRLLTKPERDLLTKRSTDVHFLAATESLFTLQDRLQGQITNEKVIVIVNDQPTEKGRLRFTGSMTNARKIRLDEVATDVPTDWARQAYLKAVQALYDAPRMFIAHYMRTFSIQDFETELAVLPVSVIFPNALKSRVYFDSAAEPKKLHFIGVMTDQQRDALLSLSTDALYRAAVNSLFTQPIAKQDTGTDLAALPISVTFANTLQSRVYLDTAAEPKKLHFIGIMTDQEHNTLRGLSTDATDPNHTAYQLAVDSLFIQPVAMQDVGTDLAALPANVTFPNALQSKVYFDTAAEPKKLHFIGFITNQEHDTLLALSTNSNDPNDTAYRFAVDNLFIQPDAFLIAPSASSELFDAQSSPEQRFLFVLKKLLPYLRRTLSERLVAQKLAETLQLEAKTTRDLLMKWVDSPTHPTQKSITEFLAQGFTESNLNAKLTAPAFQDQFKTFLLLHKIAMLVLKFKITPDQLNWLFDNGPSDGWLNFNTLPVIPIVANGSSKFAGWERLVDLFRLRDALPLGELGLFKLFDLALGAVSTTVNANRNAAKQAYLEGLSQRTLWPIEELETLLGVRNDYRVTGLLGLKFPDAYKDERILLQLRECFRLMKRLGALANQLGAWGKAKRTSAEELDNAASIKNAVKAKYDDKQWLAVAKPLKDPLREKQRAALVAYVVTHPDPEKGQYWHDVNELYEYFLVDVEMDACMGTTRILQATNSVQLFIQRCLMNLEPKVALTPEEAQEWTQWRKWYRVWEANRKVLFYPENWIEPELRDDKSPFFKDLENELLQSDVTMDTAEDAFLHYLEKLDQVARLEIMGVYHQQEPGYTARQVEPIDILHVFGRTHAIPHHYFYRRLEASVWSAWEKVDLDIEGEHLIPVEWNRRLYLYWPIFTEKADQPTKQQRLDNDDPTKYWEIKIAWSEYKNNRWSPKKVSKESLRYNKHPSPIDPKDPKYIPQEPRDFSFKTRILPSTFGEQLSIECYGTTVTQSASSTKPNTVTRKVNVYTPFVTLTGHSIHGDYVHYKIFLIHPTSASTSFSTDEVKSIEIRKIIAGEVPLEDASSDVPTFDTNSGLDTFPIQANGVVNATDGGITQPSDFYLVSKRFSVDWIEQYGCPVGAESILCVNVHLKDWSKPATKEVSTTNDKQVPGEIVLNRMQGIGEFTLDDCNGDLVATLVASTSMSPTHLEPLFGTRFENMLMVEDEVRNPGNALGSGKWLQQTPGIFRLLGPHDRYTATYLSIPFFYQDSFHTYSVSWDPVLFKLRFSSFYHPIVRDFLKSLNRSGIRGLLTLANQRLTDNAATFMQYQPNSSKVDINSIPIEDVDFSNEGAYSNYNWEVFFHTPFLIAMQLSKNQRFEDAQKWFHYIFDPTATDSPAKPDYPGPERFWRVKPFYDAAMKPIQTLEELIKDAEEMNDQIIKWKANPFKPHVIARLRVVAYMKAVVMRYIDNLIAWGDQLFRQDTIESINEATQLYVLAAQILGKRPEDIPARAKPKNQTWRTLDTPDPLDPRTKLDSLSNRFVEIESFLPPSAAPTTTAGTQGGNLVMPFFCITANDKLLGYWDTVADRLFKIRHCMNIDGVERSLPMFQPPIDPALLVRAAAAGVDIASALSDMNAALPHYRFNVMLQKATELCNDVKALGASLLSALEKKDGEELALLRSSHEVELLKAIREIKAQQIEEANNALEGLKKYQDVVTARQQYYQSRPFMNLFEEGHIALTTVSLISLIVQSGADATAAMLHLVPEAKTGGPTTVGITFGGSNLASAVQSFAAAAGATASQFSTAASLSSTLGGYQRRQDDWTHQADLATKELLQVAKQIAAAEIRFAISEHELKDHDLQIENAKEVDEFLRDRKFTNQELYGWMVGKLSGIYFQSYQLAYDIAKRAERTFRYELGLRDSNFVQFGYWDSLKKGLLSGERLHHDLKRMDAAYLDQNKREYEITKHISLNTLDPISLLTIKETGECFVSLPEALFDMDYPGHYMRRIKSVSVTIPCVTGPYAGVNCTLTQHSSSIRHASTLLAGKYSRKGDGDDTRFSDSFSSIQSIVTSSGQNDSGLFEANMRDERYLPFEGQGAISMWRIQLPTQFKSFDYDTISDVVLHLRYTARDGGALLRQHASTELSAVVNSLVQSDGQEGFARIFSLRHEYPTEWYGFLNPSASTTAAQTLTIALTRDRFPFLFQERNIETIDSMELFVKVKPDFADSHSDSTLILTLENVPPGPVTAGPASAASAPTIATQPLILASLNGLIRAEKSPAGPVGNWILTAQVDGLPNMHLNPNAIQDILLVCRYTC